MHFAQSLALEDVGSAPGLDQSVPHVRRRLGLGERQQVVARSDGLVQPVQVRAAEDLEQLRLPIKMIGS